VYKAIHLQNMADNGYTVISHVYDRAKVNAIIDTINKADTSKVTFRKTDDLFAIRQFIKELTSIKPLIFTTNLKQLITQLFGEGYFAVKSIYFDKPEKSNWFVAYHQDLTLSVNQKVELPGFGPWTIKQNQFAVQPPIAILNENFTIRIHLDDTDETNGALKVIPGSHAKGVYRAENINWEVEKEDVCAVPQGGVMVMRPLLLHASNRSTGNKRRRVIHIEFSKVDLPEPLQWSEKEIF